MTGEQKPGGLEVVAYRVKHPKHLAHRLCFVPAPSDVAEALTPAEPAEARIRELEARVAELLRESTAIAEDRRFQRDRATAVEAKLARAVEGLEAIKALSSALRQGGPGPSDLEDLSDNLEAAVDAAPVSPDTDLLKEAVGLLVMAKGGFAKDGALDREIISFLSKVAARAAHTGEG